VQEPAAWRPLQRVRTHEQVLAAIEEQIVRGNLNAGDRLPSERELADFLGVSRPSVREALRVLEWMGVVVAGVGSGKDAGSIIAGKPSEALTRLLRLHLALSHFSLDDVVRTRVTLESAAIEAAAARATAESVSPLRALLERMGDVDLEPSEFNELDTDFHVAIAVASGNKLLAELMQALRDAVQQKMVQAFERLPDYRVVADRLRAEHTAIVDAVERRDRRGAIAAVGHHIDNFYREMLEQAVT